MVERVSALGVLAFFSLSAGKANICSGQTKASASATITVVVIQATAVTALEGIKFDYFETGGRFRQTTKSKTDYGFLTVSGQPTSRVAVSIPSMVILRSNEGRTLALSTDISVWSNGNSRGEKRNEFPSVTGGTAAIGSDGLIHFRLGGAFNSCYATAGSYSGNYVLTLTY